MPRGALDELPTGRPPIGRSPRRGPEAECLRAGSPETPLLVEHPAWSRLTLPVPLSTIAQLLQSEQNPSKIMRKLILFAATGAGTGYSPIAPGTAGSLLGSGAFALLALGFDLSVGGLWIGLILLIAVGVWSGGRAEQFFACKDDGRITIDELAGVWLALITLPARVEVVVTGFLLFRIFDIWKPPPARWAESFGGGLGVVGDDLVAGLYANLAGQVLWHFVLPRGLA